MAWTRRVVLQTLGTGAVGCVMSACAGDGGGNIPPGKAAMCGANLCVSLAENPDLAVVGGVALFVEAGRQIFVLRVSETELRALSALCTHQACTVAWNGSDKFVCPCHGSQFTSTGAVARGPAGTPLRAYATMLAGDQLTIVL